MDLVVLHKSITTFWNMLLFNSRSMFPIGHQLPQKIFPFYFGILPCRPPYFFFFFKTFFDA
jgi:hypothetical protein